MLFPLFFSGQSGMKSKKPKWSEQDLLILHELRKNSRNSLVNIARITSIPTSSVFDKVNTLQKNLIRKHVSILDFSKIGYGLTAHYLLTASKKAALKHFLLRHPNTNTISMVNNGTDYFVEAIFKNMKQAEEFSEELQQFGLKYYHEHYIAEEVKREDFLSKKDHIEMV